MSNSNLYGHIDRRISTPSAPIRVQKVFDKIYNDYGVELSNDCTDPNSHFVIESEAFRKAVRKLDPEDRRVIETLVAKMSAHCGRNFGERSAEQVIAKLGIWLNLVKKTS